MCTYLVLAATNCFFLDNAIYMCIVYAVFITVSLLMLRLMVPRGIKINQLSKYCS